VRDRPGDLARYPPAPIRLDRAAAPHLLALTLTRHTPLSSYSAPELSLTRSPSHGLPLVRGPPRLSTVDDLNIFMMNNHLPEMMRIRLRR
jgi:hypothetical protein